MKTFSADDILDRLKEGLSIASDKELCKILEVSKATISNWRKRNSIDLDRVFSKCEHLNFDWLITGRGNMANIETTNERISSGIITGVPLIPIEAMAGFLSGEVCVNESECDRLNIPGLKADFVIPVSGDSMEPKYYSGDYVACQSVSLSDMFFQWGKVYVIDTNQGVLLKKVRKSKHPDCIALISENPEYDPITMPLEDIYHIALVKGLVRIV